MANWNKPDLSTLKSAFPGEVRDLATSAAKMDYSGDTNLPSSAIRYNRTDDVLEEWNGSTWIAAPIKPQGTVQTFGSITLSPVSGTYTPSTANGKILQFPSFAIISLELVGAQSVATTPRYTLSTTSPSLPNSAMVHTGFGRKVTAGVNTTLWFYNSGSSYQLWPLDAAEVFAISTHRIETTLIVLI